MDFRMWLPNDPTAIGSTSNKWALNAGLTPERALGLSLAVTDVLRFAFPRPEEAFDTIFRNDISTAEVIISEQGEPFDPARCASRVYVTEPGLGHRGKIKTARKGTGKYVIYVSDATSSGSDKAGASSQIVPQMMNLVQGLHDLSDPDRGITVNVGTLVALARMPTRRRALLGALLA